MLTFYNHKLLVQLKKKFKIKFSDYLSIAGVFISTGTVYFQEDIHCYKFEVNQVSSSLDCIHIATHVHIYYIPYALTIYFPIRVA